MNTGEAQLPRCGVTRPRQEEASYGVDLLWLPLGVRGNFIRIGGKIYETIAALLDRREPHELYHSVLSVSAPEGRFVIEMGPVADVNGARRGVVIEGPVGGRLAGRFRIFRYEVRCWRDGITAYDFAVGSRQLTDDREQAERVLQLVRHVPALTWGRDQLRTGERWSCNSLTSWLLTLSGHDVDRLRPPAGGRAPGWTAGALVARRQSQREVGIRGEAGHSAGALRA